MFHIFSVSDASGTTAERVVSAALVQFDPSQVEITRYGGVRTPARIREIISEAADRGGFIVHTFVSEDLRNAMLAEGRHWNIATIDLMGPLLARLSELLNTRPRAEPGEVRIFDSGYLRRIDAIDFTVRHDDGRSTFYLDRAEIVLTGVSRTSKTPLSIYLAYRGWKVANVPIVLGIEPPPQLFALPRRRVVCLIVQPDRLVSLRKTRVEKMGTYAKGYADLEHIRRECVFAYDIYNRRPDWPQVDVTAKPIEEAASEVVSLIGHQLDESEDLV